MSKINDFYDFKLFIKVYKGALFVTRKHISIMYT